MVGLGGFSKPEDDRRTRLREIAAACVDFGSLAGAVVQPQSNSRARGRRIAGFSLQANDERSVPLDALCRRDRPILTVGERIVKGPEMRILILAGLPCTVRLW